MKTIHAERLLRLAEFLETVPKERFDLSSWVGEDWGGKQDLSCGTTACAMGWAATMPEFRELGLKIASQGRRVYVGEPEDGYSSSAYAIISIFGPEAEEEVLFYPGGWGSGGGGEDSPTPWGFANRIRRFVKELSE